MLEGMVRKQTEKQAQTLDSWLEKHDREVPFPEGGSSARGSGLHG